MGFPAGVFIIGVAAAAYAICTIQAEQELNTHEEDEEEEEIDHNMPLEQPAQLRCQTGPRFCTHPPENRCESPPISALPPLRRRRRDRARDVLATADGKLRRGMLKVKNRLLAANRRNVGAGDSDIVQNISEHNEQVEDVCVIDLEPIRAGDVAVRLPCLHEFHAECILPYLNSSDEPCCPIDRCPIPRDDLHLLPIWTVPE